MRIWDIKPKFLCRKHLLGEHNELHAIWSIITKNKKGYSKHPEVIRWQGKLKALFFRHELLVKEMEKRDYKHNSFLEKVFAKGSFKQNIFINSLPEQKFILIKKKCDCLL
jgi:hypothetical protein